MTAVPRAPGGCSARGLNPKIVPEGPPHAPEAEWRPSPYLIPGGANRGSVGTSLECPESCPSPFRPPTHTHISVMALLYSPVLALWACIAGLLGRPRPHTCRGEIESGSSG